MNFDEAFDQTVAYLKANIPTALWGHPGIGKSALAQKVADTFKLEFIDIRLGQLDPVDLAGYPEKGNGSFGYLPYEEFPLESTPIPEGKAGWLIMFDEINTAPRQNLSASYKIILDRKIGRHKLHPKCRIITGGNYAGEGSLAGALPLPLVSRLAHINLVPELTPVLKTILGSTIFDFLSANPKYIYMAPQVPNTPYPTLRAWEMVSKVEAANPTNDRMQAVRSIIGIVGEEAAVHYATFAEEHFELEKIMENSAEYPLEHSQALIDLMSTDPSLLKSNIDKFQSEWKTIARSKLAELETDDIPF